MGFVAIEWDRVRDLIRREVDLHRQLQLAQRCHHRLIKSCDRLRPERENPERAVTLQNAQFMTDEIEPDLESVEAMRDG